MAEWHLLSYTLMNTATTTAHEHRHGERTAYGELAVVVVLWGINWPLIKLMLPFLTPLTLLVVRFFGAAVIAAVMAALSRQRVAPRREELLPLFGVGLLQIAFPMALGVGALLYLGAGRATVLVYTMQLWALPLGWLILKERMTGWRVAGGVIGFAGIVLFLNPALVNWADRRVLVGNLMVIVSAMLWGAGSCCYRLRRWQTPQWSQLAWQFLTGAIVLELLGWIFGIKHRIEWNWLVIGVMSYNCVLAITAAYWLWNRALRVLPATKAGQMASLVPVLSVLISAAFLGERITAMAVVSVALILGGICATLRSR